jgi:hypothetical protein
MRKNILFLVLFLSFKLFASHLTPGFDGNEFRKLFAVSGYQIDTPWTKTWMPYPVGYDLIYRSPISGLDNRWDLWLRKDSVCVISIRGTTGSFDSWLENFYAGMIPATGKLILENGKTFDYKLANDSNANVHIGWTVGLAYMAPDIVAKINEQYKKGVKDFYIMGHSQGGAIGFLLTSYLYYEKGKSIPADVNFKTYGSGVPKVGDLFYGYDFDFITRGGWAFRVINTADWVPEVPFSIQGLNDLSTGNPFANVSRLVGNNPAAKYEAKHVIRKLNRVVRHAQRRFTKYLGKKSGFFVRKKIDGFPKQKYSKCLNYVACGIPIILVPDANYHKLFPDDGKSIFRHHSFSAYLYLLNLYYPVT